MLKGPFSAADNNRLIALSCGLHAHITVGWNYDLVLIITDQGEDDFFERLDRAKSDPKWISDVKWFPYLYSPENVIDKLRIVIRNQKYAEFEQNAAPLD